MSAQLDPPALHLGLRAVAGVVSVAVGVSSFAQGIGAVRGEHVLWLALGFAAVGVLASVLGVLTGMGRFRAGPAMALACVGGTVIVASGFGRLVVEVNIAGVLGDWIFRGHVLAGLVIAACGGVGVLNRCEKSWRWFLIGAGMLGVAGGLVGGVMVWKGGPMTTPTTGLPEILRVLGLLVGAAGVGTLVSVGGHLVIRAFQVTAEQCVESGPGNDVGADAGAAKSGGVSAE